MRARVLLNVVATEIEQGTYPVKVFFVRERSDAPQPHLASALNGTHQEGFGVVVGMMSRCNFASVNKHCEFANGIATSRAQVVLTESIRIEPFKLKNFFERKLVQLQLSLLSKNTNPNSFLL